MKQIVSFGDSFVLGSEIDDNQDGSRAWPALVAKNLGYGYQTFAEVGVGNEHIAQQIYRYFRNNSTDNTLAVINWTWSMRWDLFLLTKNKWISLGPTCVPSKLFSLVDDKEAIRLIGFYNDYLKNSAAWNQFRSLQTIFATQSYLKTKKIKSIQTFMDRTLWDNTFDQDPIEHYNINRDESWPIVENIIDIETLPDYIQQELALSFGKIEVPDYTKDLQDLTWSDMLTFDNQTFLEWSRHHGFAITPSPGDHPLAEAHINAAAFWLESYREIMDSDV